MAEAADFPGTSPSPARRWLRRAGALLVAVPLLAGLVQLPQTPLSHAAGKTSAAEATGSRTVDVAVNSLTPTAPGEDDTLTISGTVTNSGKQTVTTAEVGLRVGPPLNSRSAIDSAAQRTSYVPGADGNQISSEYVQEFAKLAPGVPQTFSISVPVKELHLGADGVYQLAVTLTGQTTAQPWTQVLGVQRTFLPWQPGETDTKTRTTYLWPLISSTHVTAETGSDEQQTPVLEDDSLAEEISPGGRLERMVALGADLDVTWVIDPDLLASVDAMTRSYRIRATSGTTAGKNQAVAKQWLDNLEKAVADKKVVALPFADPDLASLAHNGKNVSGSLGHLKDATDAAVRTVETVLHVEPSTDFAWPVEGAVDPSIVEVATSAGADMVIARSDSMQETSGLTYTPSAARPIGGGTTAVVADARLSTAFEGDMTGAEKSTLAVQEFLAQSLMITLQEPQKQRSIVVAPQRMPSASQAQTMATALTALDEDRWSEAQDLSAAAKAKPDPDATTQVPSTKEYPSALRKQELPQSAFEAIQETQQALDSFTVILTDSSRVVTPFGRAIDRQMSTSWRGRAAEAQQFREGVQSYLEGLTQQVKLIDKSPAKLSGRSATIPVTVQNNLVQGVDRLVLRLTSTKPKRLQIGDGDYQEQAVRVAGGHSQTVKFTTTTNANGPVPVIAQLYTEDGQRYGPEVSFDLEVTEVPPSVMLVIAGGLLLLVLAGFRMYTQRKRATARQADAPEGGPEQESRAESGAADPGQPSDPTPDTAPESTDPSGTGERVDR
ncbi:hypothetical protein H1V43_16270 [Streptomyces sp. PSKA54]|uniref:Uncharacterized protein n=1 Tax=Streptomyces himalayensis subsp. aureolus TaxID=2758039 RepID=A0A7W2HGF8_9ACTN|nr:DUF6049 family protein [Streptomyces himalayensis]MBA4862922.1 hypothetical protein [Streptomyces himalayensis subsp. aureolus]